MKHLMKVSLVAFIAMFAFSTVADAQKVKLALPKAGGGSEITFTRKDSDGDITEVAKWNPTTCEITIGSEIYKVDTKTGQVTDSKGASKGSMNAKGSIESPNFGTLDLVADGVLLYVNKGGERLGAMVSTMGEIYYGARNKGDNGFASDKSVNPLLMSYIYFGLIYTQDDLDIKAGKKTKPVKIKYKPYNASEPIQEGFARTIFTMPGTGKKMMLDYRATAIKGSSNVDAEWVKNALDNKWKDAKFLEKAKEAFMEWAKKSTPYGLLGVRKPDDVKFKIGYIGTQKSSWEYSRDKWGELYCRFAVINVVLEFSDGENILCEFDADQPHIGGGNYDADAIEIQYRNNNKGTTCQKARTLNGWEVKTDCYTSTLTNK